MRDLLEFLKGVRPFQQDHNEPSDGSFYRELDGYEPRWYKKKFSEAKQASIKSFFPAPNTLN
ncbi:hypothetical protein E4U52_008241 [Claviceps spartinae]|nr:hypothetical protein E4U52_008241 [Claviceps spartinae]